VVGGKTVLADHSPDGKNGLDKAQTNVCGAVAGDFQDRVNEELERDALEDVRVLIAQDAVEKSQ
jgi:hypothetical protein